MGCTKADDTTTYSGTIQWETESDTRRSCQYLAGMKMIPTYRNRRCHRLGTVQPTVSTDFSNAESFPIQLPARCRLRQGAEEGCCQGAMPAETMEIHVCCHSESERLGIVEALLERGSVIIGTPFAEGRHNGRGANGMCSAVQSTVAGKPLASATAYMTEVT